MGYPLALSVFKILSETMSYVSSFEQDLRSLVSSPLTRLAKVPLGWEELYSRYWNLLVLWRGGLGPVAAALLTVRAVPLPSSPLVGLVECLDIRQYKPISSEEKFLIQPKRKTINVSHNMSMLRQDLKKWRVLVSL